MNRFVTAVRNSISEKNWLAALAMALTLPDICANIEGTEGKPAEKYKTWFDKNLKHIYLGGAAGQEPLLSGSDCYALRCSYLHDGSESPGDHHKARQVIKRYHFREPDFFMHRNRINDTLQLRVDLFCEEICTAVEQWENSLLVTSEVQARLGSLLFVRKGMEGIAEIGGVVQSMDDAEKEIEMRARKYDMLFGGPPNHTGAPIPDTDPPKA